LFCFFQICRKQDFQIWETDLPSNFLKDAHASTPHLAIKLHHSSNYKTIIANRLQSKVNLCSKQRRMSSPTALAKINTVNRKRLCSSDQLTSSLLPRIDTTQRSAAQQMTFASSSLLPSINTAQHSAAQQKSFATHGFRRSLTAPTSDFSFGTSEFGFQILDIGFRISDFRPAVPQLL
jgi:hypothetical protein